MAEDDRKRVKVEEPDSTEAINTLNEEATEKKLTEEANKKAKSGPDDAIASTEQANNINNNAEPVPLVTEEGRGELFPGVPCTTVTKQCKKGNNNPAPLYLNWYGPRA